MKISASEVVAVSNLAKIRLTVAQASKFRTDLSAIIDYNAAKLAALRSKGAVALVEGKGLGQADEARPSLTPELALGNAPEEKNGFIVVPKMLGES